MTQNTNFIIISTTFNSLQKAQEISLALLTQKLAGCTQIQNIVSNYVYNQQICTENEFLLTIKTTQNLFFKIANYLTLHHNYEIPQIIATPISNISPQYQQWLARNLLPHD
jgi:periplasmic divalent cation tolerance protein